MKIAHVTEYCHASSSGGTERYIRDLALELARLGHSNEILWMNSDPEPAAGLSTEIPIHKLPRSSMRVDDPPAGLAQQAHDRLSGPHRPDVLHFHTLGRSEAEVAKVARRLGIPCALTYHSPAWTCRRETMLLWGKEPCDGEMRVLRCSACKAQERMGGAPWIGQAAALASLVAGPLIAGSGSWHRRLAFTADTAAFRRDITAFMKQCDLVVSCAEWSIAVLQANGARTERIIHLPQGVPLGAHAPVQRRDFPAGEPFVIGYIGRMNEVKGIHILVEAFRGVPFPDARLKIYGWNESAQLQDYGRRLKALAGDDARIQFIPEKSAGEILAEYATLSLLAIPSVWLETGPLTLLEALQAGIPVYASSRMGQRGLLEQYGRVVEPNEPQAWTQALTEACMQHQRGAWKPVVLREPLATMTTVAERMADEYARMVVKP